MVQELAEQKQYRTLEEYSKEELWAIADALGLKLPKSLGLPTLAQAIRVKQTRLNLDAEAEARAQRTRENMEGDKKPTFEDVLIYGGEFMGKTYEPSPKYIYRFINELDQGQDFPCSKPTRFFARIYPQDKEKNPLMCVMPQCLAEKPEKPPADASRADELEYELKRAISLAEIGYPIWKDRPDPKNPGAIIPTIVGLAPRFTFIRVKKAPKDAPYGMFFGDVNEGET